MDVRSGLDLLRQRMKTEQHFSHESVDEVINYFQASGSLYCDDSQGEFVKTHLGWVVIRSNLTEQRKYVHDFLLAEDAWHR